MSTTASRPPRSDRRPPQRAGGGSEHRGLYRRYLDNDLHFTPGSADRRMKALSIALVIVLAVFGVRLLQVQVVDSSAMAQRAESGRLATHTLKAQRGTIYDANGVPLAESVDARNIAVDQTIIGDPAVAAAQLAPVLGLPVEDVQKSLTGDKKFAYVARNLTPEVAQAAIDLQLPGVAAEKTLKREYAGGALGANVLGFVGSEGQGLAGIELELDQTLAGRDGARSVEVADGKLIPTGTDQETDPVPGDSVRLTLDRDLQWAAQSALAKQVQASQARSGTAILMEVKTGKILAMASVPTLDPNNPAASDPADQQNRAVVEAFEPGSTSKFMTMAAVINEGKADPSTVFTVPSTIYRDSGNYSDHDPHPTYQMTLAGILAKSSNTGSIQAAEMIGPDKFREYLKRFGVGEPTGLGFPGEANGYVAPVSDWSGSSFPTMAFGQGLSLTALQVTSVFQTIANGGVRITPQLVAGTVTPDGKETPAAAPESHRVVEEKTAKDVLAMAEGVVSPDGTAKNAAIEGYRIAGKTGTADRIDESCGCYRGTTASFVGIVPADDPQLVAGVFVQDPQADYMGAANGAPVFKQLMTAALQSRKIPPSNSPAPHLPIYAGDSGPAQ